MVTAFLLSCTWAQAQSPAESIAVVTEKIAAYPDDARLYVKRASLYLENNDPVSAGLDLETASALSGEIFAPLLLVKSKYYFVLGDNATALSYIDDFLAIRKVHSDGFLLKANILAATGRIDDAIDFYKKALVHADQPTDAYYTSLVQLLESRGRSAEAQFYCKTARRDLGHDICSTSN